MDPTKGLTGIPETDAKLGPGRFFQFDDTPQMHGTFMRAPTSMPPPRTSTGWPVNTDGWPVRQSGQFHATHQGGQCDLCGEKPITGIRYNCLNCPDYDCCMKCEISHPHDKAHTSAKIHTPTRVLPTRTLCPNFYSQ